MCRGHAAQERDLRIPALDRERGAIVQRPARALLHDLLLRRRQGDAVPVAFAFFPEPSDLLQEHQDVVGGSVVECPLDGAEVELGPAPHDRATHVDRDAFSGGVEVHRPQQGGTVLSGQEAGRALTQDFGMQRCPAIRSVERQAAPMGLLVERPERIDERCHVGDRVVDPIARTAALDVNRLVEITRLRRVDRHQRQVGPVGGGHPGPGRGLAGTCLHPLGKGVRHVELCADPGETGTNVLPVGGGEADRTSMHGR
jgi:hypothetical protein